MAAQKEKPQRVQIVKGFSETTLLRERIKVNTITKHEQSATAPGQPTFQQMAALAITKAESDLKTICKIRCADERWNDDDVDVDNAVELALCQIQRMKEVEFADFGQFATNWYMAGAAINLGVKAFSRDDCAYKRFLTGASEMFGQMAEMVEFVDRKA